MLVFFQTSDLRFDTRREKCLVGEGVLREELAKCLDQRAHW